MKDAPAIGLARLPRDLRDPLAVTRRRTCLERLQRSFAASVHAVRKSERTTLGAA